MDNTSGEHAVWSKLGCWVAIVLTFGCALGWTVNADELELEGDFAAACASDPAKCGELIGALVDDGTLDQDRDGVSDLDDWCPGSRVPLLHQLLLGQEAAYNDALETTILVRELLLQGANGTQDGEVRRILAGEVVRLFDELVRVANTETDGHYLFDALRSDGPPFEIVGDFSGAEVSTVSYVGSQDVIEHIHDRPPGVFVISTPGDVAFLGDADVFELLLEAYARFVANDQDGIAALLQAGGEASLALMHQRDDTGDLLDFLLDDQPLRETIGVDTAGCSVTQFCGAITIDTWKDLKRCKRSDFKNNEPLRRDPKDCRIGGSKAKGGQVCAPR